MKYTDLPSDAMGLIIHILDDGDIGVTVMHNLSDDFDEEDAEPYLDLLNGINMILGHTPELFQMYGSIARMLKTVLEEDESEIEFEPDEELLKAIKERNVVPFKKPH